MKQNFSRWLTPMVWRAVVIAIPTLLNTGPVAADELKYWISEHYSEAPNVNTSAIAGHVSNFSPTVFKPDLPSVSDPNTADVLVCFDNRPLHEADLPPTIDIPGTSDRGISFCESRDDIEGYGYYRHPKRKRNSKKIIDGLTISKTSNGKIYCEAIFTGQSLFFLLGLDNSFFNYKNANSPIVPYTMGDFPYGSKEAQRGLFRHLDASDRATTVSTVAGKVIFQELALDHSWSCLLPAFQLYWRDAFHQCQLGARSLDKELFRSQIEHDLLKENYEEILRITKSCKRKN
ncbi:hypothetical protein [Roseibium sp.]|uniref:hypothetical protein n=1 Tax=Roseibium sp. TaxID=1936156 RepID=UPI003BB043D1